MEEPLLASSFLPPEFHVAVAAAADATISPPRYPPWVLLDSKAYFADRENTTTATATSSTGHEVKITFCLADPPAVSHFCVYGPNFKLEHFVEEPRVVSSEKDLVLLSFVFTGDPRSTVPDCAHGEYFIYRAGKQSLTPIPATPRGITNTLCVGVVPCGDKDEFFLADLYITTTLGYYDLSIYSSKTETWTPRRLELQSSSEIRAVDLFIVPHKVISLGEGRVGWVDLWRGIIACNILEEEPFIYFIPLPKPDFNLPRCGNPKPVRDVICCDGVIKFVEMDHYFRQEVVGRSKRFKVTEDLDGVDRMYDSEILLLPHEDFLEAPGEQIIRIPDGWKIRTCYRHISWNHWRKGHSVHVDEIVANNPEHSLMLPQMSDGCGNSTLRNLTTAYPTLRLNGGDVVYLMSKVGYYDKNAWMVGVDLGNKTVEILEPYDAERASYFKPDCLPCAFSEFLNPTPRSFAEEAAFASNEAQDCVLRDHLLSGCIGEADCGAPGCIYSNTQHLPPPMSGSGCIGDADREAPGCIYSNTHYQPQLLSSLPQPLHLDLTSSGSGHVHPVKSQSMYPVVGPDASGQLWLSVPLGEDFLSQLLQLAGRLRQESVAEVQPIGEPGHVHQVKSQSMYPVLRPDANGQLWLSVPLVEDILLQLLQQADQPLTPLMRQESVAEVQPTGGIPIGEPAHLISMSPGTTCIEDDEGSWVEAYGGFLV